MASLYTQQGKNVFRTWMLMGIFLMLVIAVGFVMSQYYGNPGVLYLAVAFSLV
ncbi:zinc metalloprotease HtpX, partial [Candidatus Kaiserbacteria bacterium]|nr:zinc metalloprotease HtpX [Candidatus Kaiserbacteria bacterium]